ncbi:MAG: SRPBCC family protein, partial [Microthrixaceae bacterium]
MELENSFTVEVGVDRTWEVLNDIPAIAPCLPGAQLQEVDGDDYKGIVKVKVGPIVAQYKGTATVEEASEADHRIVLKADGRETRGQGNASAVITATLKEVDGGTEVAVATELTVTGKVAQFGRG